MSVHPLHSYLRKRQETVTAFAARIGIQQASLSRALAGLRGLSLETALRIEAETAGAVPAACWLKQPPKRRPAA